MTVHEDEWRRMPIEERIDKLRLQLFVQEVLIKSLIQGLRGAGINVVMTDDTDEPDQPGE